MEAQATRRRAKDAIRGRAILGWSLVFFAATLLCLNLGLDNWWPEVRDAHNGPQLLVKQQRLRARIAAAPNRPLVLMLGSSITLMGFRAELLDGMPAADGRPILAFNYGLFKTMTYGETMLWHSLRRKGVRPRLLLIEVVPLFLDSGAVGRWSEEDAALYVPGIRAAELPWLARLVPRPAELCWTWLESRLLPPFSPCGQAIWRRLRGGSLPREARDLYGLATMGPCGWVPCPWNVPPEKRPRLIRDLQDSWRGQYPETFSHFRIGAGPRRALTDLLELCRTDGVPVALVMMPQGSGFRAMFGADMESRLQQFLGEVRDQYGVPTVDARAWLPDEAFSDHVHLCADGATRFTNRFRGEVSRLLGSCHRIPQVR
jgi:hypothetical protein